MKEINSRISIPLALHGGSGTPENILTECIHYGINKINIASELKLAYHSGMVNAINRNLNEFEPRVIFPEAQNEAKKVICRKIELCGSAGKA